MKNIFLFSLFISSFQLFGRIEIANIFPTPSENECLGVIQLRLVGTGGSFDVLIEETGQLLQNVEGLVPIENLCSGQYTLKISISGFGACQKTLNADILIADNGNNGINPLITSSGHKPISLDSPAFSVKKQSFDKNISVMPNPNMGQFNIQFEGGILPETNYEIYSSLGELIQAGEIITPSTAINLYSKPPGTYFIRCIRENEVIQTTEVIIQ